MNLRHLLVIVAAWVSIVYVVCFGGVALFPSLRELFLQYALHTNTVIGGNVITLSTFIAGLIVWNVIASLAISLFVVLFNKIKT